MDKEKIKQLAEFINESQSITFFTGAGISCASGIPDFRSQKTGIFMQGSTHGYSPEEIISHSFFINNPRLFYQFYREKMVFPLAKPNDGHLFITKLQDKKDVKVVTQNIDGLHTLAGNKEVYEIHGTIMKNHCIRCQKSYALSSLLSCEGIPVCERCGGIIKPDVVLYEEMLDGALIAKAVDAIKKCDCLIVMGTSLVVQPAASFVTCYQGDKAVLINKQATNMDNQMNLVFQDDIIEVVRAVTPYIRL